MNLEKIEQAIKLMQSYSLQELEWEGKNEKLKLVQDSPQTVRYNDVGSRELTGAVKASTPQEALSQEASSPTQAVSSESKEIKSPFVGTFYIAPSPGADEFVKVGQRVKKGDTLCIVEAMKLMNEIEAESDGVISAILVDNEAPVEFDQALFLVE